MKHCTIAYSVYITDFRVRRYAEALTEKCEQTDALVVSAENTSVKNVVFNGVNVHFIQSRRAGESNKWEYIFRICNFFIKTFFIFTKSNFQHKYDVVHVHNLPDFLVFTTLIAKLNGTKIILDIHDIMPELFIERFLKGKKKSVFTKLLFMLENMSLHFADYVIVANDLWRERLIKRTGISEDKCLTMLNYPNLSFFQKKNREKKLSGTRLLYPGHLSYHHGVDIAIESLKLLKKEVSQVFLDIYARTYVAGYRKYLEGKIEEYKLNDSITIHQGLPPEKLSMAFENATIGIVPKREGSFTSEAFSSKILDFFAAGIPVILSKTTIDEYYFDDTIVSFFNPGDPNDMAKKILEIIENPGKAEMLVKNGYEFVKRNNWGVMKDKYYNILNQIYGTKTNILFSSID